jgi:3-deoxy-D-manno-octulosonic-acid transferase
MGADAAKVMVLGNLKYDVMGTARPLEPALARVLEVWNPLWIAASTMNGEEELILDAFGELRSSVPKLRLAIAPRHPGRFDAVEHLVRNRGYSCVRRTRLNGFDGNTDVLLLDTIGELDAAFRYASAVFMGGTLVPKGGHNVLEPARHQKPIVFGPHMENFRDIARLFIDGRAAIQIAHAGELARTIKNILSDPDLAVSLGSNAKKVVEQNAGATERIMTQLHAGETPR